MDTGRREVSRANAGDDGVTVGRRDIQPFGEKRRLD